MDYTRGTFTGIKCFYGLLKIFFCGKSRLENTDDRMTGYLQIAK